MLVHIAGVCHLDPKGKDNLKIWLAELSDAYDKPPAFVGVEYDQDRFAELKRQRSLLRQAMQAYCPAACPDLLDALADCLAYEPDAVAEVFPDAERLWLDAGTVCPADKRHRTWLNSFRDTISQKKVFFPAPSAEVLDLLSQASWEPFQRQGPQPTDSRDEKFAGVVLKKREQGSGGWAIVIVGANHASNNEGSMRCRLAAAGIECKACWIKPNGPVPA